VSTKNLLYIFSVIIIVNAAGLILRYFELETYFILIGFRFHIAFIIPFLLVFRSKHTSLFKETFTKAEYKDITPFLLWIILPLILSFAVLFLSGEITIADPAYFYEFGLSSIFDYPIYLIWNAPQLFLLYLFVMISIQSGKMKFIKTFLILLFLFAFEFIPINKESFAYLEIISLISIALVSGLVIKYFSNIYFLTFFIFTLFWSNLLLFGSSSKKMINIIFAANYETWEGFFTANKLFSEYILPVNLTLVLIFILLSVLFRKTDTR
jgi:hypothetical protein